MGKMKVSSVLLATVCYVRGETVPLASGFDLPLGDEVWLGWSNHTPPAGNPFPISTDIIGWEYANGSNPSYGGADTWYPTWAADDNLYTPWTDGHVGGVNSHSGSGGSSYNSTTGMATVRGNDPFNLNVTDVHTFESSTWPYRGRYPCGSLSVNGTWYYGTYFLANPNATTVFPDGSTKTVGPNPGPNCGNWCVQGPAVSFRSSSDNGQTWLEPRIRSKGIRDNLFGETAFDNERVKFGAPHFIDFGKNMEHSPDGMAYVVGHGATNRSNVQAWMLGDQVYIARVVPTVENINDVSKWEFYGGSQAGWVKGDITAARPIVEWDRNMGVVTMSYHSAIKKYILCISTASTYPSMTRDFDTYFLESSSLTEGWSLFQYNRAFGPESYFVNHPTKFMATTLDSSGKYNLFLSYSANFAEDRGKAGIPVGSGYHWSLQQTRFTLSKEFRARLEQ